MDLISTRLASALRPISALRWVFLLASMACAGDPPAAEDGGAQDGGATPDATLIRFDVGTSFDAFDPPDGWDAGPGPDAGLCTDEAVLCGTEPTTGCDCLAGEPVDLVTLGTRNRQWAVALADNGVGATLLQARQLGDRAPGAGRYRLQALLIDRSDALVGTPNILSETLGYHFAVARTDEFFYLAWQDDTEEDVLGRLRVAQVAIADGTLTAPPRELFAPSAPITSLGTATDGESQAVAYSRATSPERGDDAISFFVVPSGGSDPVVTELVRAPLIQSVAIAPSDSGWLLLYADRESVHSQQLDPQGALVGEATLLDRSSYVTSIHLVATDSGFAAAWGSGSSGSFLHTLDSQGVSTAFIPVSGGLSALERDGDSLMMVGNARLECVGEPRGVAFHRLDSSLAPLQAPVLFDGDRSFVVARIGDEYRVAYTFVFGDVVQRIVDVCVLPPTR